MEEGGCNKDKSNVNGPFSLQYQCHKPCSESQTCFLYEAYQVTMSSYPFLLTLHITYKEYQHYHIYWQHLPQCANEQGK
jgi:hypothetical protein